MDQEGIKILFSFHSDLLERWTIETMWANVVDENNGWYRLDSIPFYAQGVALGDVIQAAYSEEQERLQFQEVVEPGGHSTVQVIVTGNAPDPEPFHTTLQYKGCSSEGVNASLLVVDIPPEVDYLPIKALLDQWEADGLIFYAESCLSVVHYYE